MEAKAGDIQILQFRCKFQQLQNSHALPNLAGANSASPAGEIKLLKPLMLEATNHSLSVNRMVYMVKESFKGASLEIENATWGWPHLNSDSATSLKKVRIHRESNRAFLTNGGNGKLPRMAAPNKKKLREWSFFSLAMTCIAGGLSLLGFPIPRWIGLLILTTGCIALLCFLWKVSSRLPIAFRISIVVVALAFCCFAGWQIYPRKSSTLVIRRPDQKPPPGAEQPQSVAPHEFSIVLYNGVSDPDFFIDGRSSPPIRYASGIATFRLTAGTHLIRAEYPGRTCSATVSVPSSGPLAATCNMK